MPREGPALYLAPRRAQFTELVVANLCFPLPRDLCFPLPRDLCCLWVWGLLYPEHGSVVRNLPPGDAGDVSD